MQIYSMKMHVIKNAPYEGPEYIAKWALEQGHDVQTTPLYNDAPSPSIESFDWLVIMGGPMSVQDEKEHPWLIREKALVERAIAEDKIVLGVCLGAQLIAQVLGARVYRNEYIERGWQTIKREPGALDSKCFYSIPEEFTAFVWHGDTFDLPKNSKHIASSVACTNHAFEYGDRVVGLQYHLEVTPESIESIMENGSYPLVEGPYVQTHKQIVDQMDDVQSLPALLDQLLERLCKI